MSYSEDFLDMYKPTEICKNCISSMKVKGRERKIKCCNVKSPYYRKVINKNNVCDFYECESFMNNVAGKMKDMDPEYTNIVNKKFWDLF